MADLGIDSFISSLQRGGMRPNLFKVSIQSPYGNYDEFEFRCKATSIPGKTTGIIPVPFMGIDAKIPGNPTYEDWNCTVLSDEGLEIRRTFEDWADAIINPETNNSTDSVVKNHMVNGTITAYNRDGTEGAQYEVRGIWPITVASLALSWDAKDTIGEFDVGFAVQYFVRLK